MIPLGFILRIAAPIAIAVGVFTWGYSAGSASTQRKWDLATAAQVKAQLAATEAARATEQALQIKVKEAEDARQQDNAKNARIASGLRADRDRLRDSIAGFASGPAEDSADACRNRAATLGNVLATALRSAEECAGAAESLANDVRTLQRAWPVSP
jgi:hypothetical protein